MFVVKPKIAMKYYMFKHKFSKSKCFVFFSLFSVVTMVIKSAVEDDDSGWGLGIPDKMKNNANWVDITHDFKGACKGTDCTNHCVCVQF